MAVFYRVNYASGWSARVVDVGLIVSIPAAWLIRIPINQAVLGFAFAALLPVLHRYDTSVASTRALRPLFLCGQMCYSLYLVHQLPVRAVSAGLYALGLSGAWLTLLLTMPLSVAVSVALGWLFHITVERRFLNAPHQASVPAAEVAPAGTVPVLSHSI